MKLFLLPLLLITFGRADVENTISRYLAEHYPVADAEYVCDYSRLNIAGLDRYDSVAVDGFGKDIPRGNVVVKLSFFNDGSRTYSTAGTIKVGIIKEVLTSNGPIKAGDCFSSQNLSVETRDIASIDENAFTSVEQLQNVVASRYIPPGRIVTSSMAAEPAAVNPGDIVEILYRKGSITLKAKGMVKKSGAINSDVRVVNFDSKKLITARVIDSTTVTVTPGEVM